MAVFGMPRAVAFPNVDRRTLVGIALAAMAAVLVLVITRPAPTVPVLVAAADLPAGSPLSSSSVTVRHYSSEKGVVSGSSIGDLAGWSLAAPIAAGEPLIPSLLRPPARLESPDLLAVSVPEAHAVLGLLAPGDRVDIFVTWPGSAGESGTTELLATAVYVVEARQESSSLSASADVDLLLAVDGELALSLARAVRSGELDLVKVSP